MRAALVSGSFLVCLACSSAPPRSAATPADPPPAPPAPLAVQIIAFNDFHGYISPPSDGVKTPSGEVPAGGAAYLARYIADLRAASPNTAVVVAGDLIGASPMPSALFHDEPTIAVMNAIGIDVLGVGNHEFDEGVIELLRMKSGGCHPKDGCGGGQFAGAKFDVLAANVKKVGEDATIFPPYAVRTFEGISVAFIGMTLEGTPSVTPPTVKDLQFLDEADTVNALVPELKAKGIETIVVVLHEGGMPEGGGYDDCNGLSGAILELNKRFDPAIDAIVTGHTHQAYNCNLDGRLVTSAGCYGRLLTQISLSIDRGSKDVIKKEARNLIVDHKVEPDPEIQKLVDQAEATAAPIANRVVAEITAELSKRHNDSGESVLGNVIADGQLVALSSPEKGGAVIALMNSGGIRTGIDFAKAEGEAKDGLVSYGEIFAVQPFGNTIVTTTLTGDQIVKLLEGQWDRDGEPHFLQVSRTLTYAWDPDAAAGAHIDRTSIKIDGKKLDPTKKYRVAVNSFMAQRGILSQGEDLRSGPPDIEAFEAYLASKKPFPPPLLNRITKKTPKKKKR